MTPVLLVSDHDRTQYIGELNFTSEDAAHFYMRAEMPDQCYCFAEEEQVMFEPNPYVIDESYILENENISHAS